MESKKDINFFARTNFRQGGVKFGIKQKDRRQHMYVIGKTGVGKTELLKNMALQDVQNGHGLAIIDPHGEFVEEVLEQIPSHRVNDVIYFNPADVDNPIGFNILEVSDPEQKHLVASGLMGIFTKIWANVWSARMEYILNNCLLALLDTPNTTLLGITRMLVDKSYRRKIIDNVKDPMVKSFWINEYEKWEPRFQNEAIAPIQNKVGQFLAVALIRNIVGQTKSTINIQDIMDNKKILLVNVSKGLVGEDNSALLGAMLITKIQLAAMDRVKIDQEKRNDFYLYVDEFQNFVTDSFADILSEARKYRLNLIFAHQYIGQLVTDTTTKVRDAVFGNVGTLISFRVGAADAEFLEKEFDPVFFANDLVNLENYNIYLRLLIDGVTSRPFSAVTLPPQNADKNTPSNREKVIAVSRERYSRKKDEIEGKISRWTESVEVAPVGNKNNFKKKLGNVVNFQQAKKVSNSTNLSREYQNKIAKSNLKLADKQTERKKSQLETEPKLAYQSQCWACGIKIDLNFMPDGKRPVYCKECLALARSRKSRTGEEIDLPFKAKLKKDVKDKLLNE